jgi:diaminopimelate epimerase
MLFKENCFFEAFDGHHRARLDAFGLVKMDMKELSIISKKDNFWKLDTGSPHLVTFSDDIDTLDVKTEGSKIRNSDDYITNGINVNFVQIKGDEIYIRTYERGVEDETLACGTGAVASAIASFESNLISVTEINVHTLGGILKVQFEKKNKRYCNIILTGEARFVYEGKVKI